MKYYFFYKKSKVKAQLKQLEKKRQLCAGILKPNSEWPHFDPWVGNIPWRRDRLPTPVFLGFFCGSAGKEPACNAEDLCLFRGLRRSPEEGKGYPLQYSGLENSMDCIVHGVPKSWTQLSDFHFHFLAWMHTH